jgi:5'-nucleotidase (lipoprotein e(P4) family)
MKAGMAIALVASAAGLTACSTVAVVRPPEGGATRNDNVTLAASVPAGMQYLYGSGEASAISIQAWRSLVAYAAEQVRVRPADSVVLDRGSTLAAPRFVPCGGKPLAAVFDVDETVLLNLGYEADDAAHPGRAYDERRWQSWERTGVGKAAAVPGARKALDMLRAMGVSVVFNTNRSAVNARATERALDNAGLGAAVHGQTLWLKGDDATGSLKDARRWQIADRFCVIAMAGDQLGDFSDLFNAGLSPQPRRAAVSVPPLSAKWGAGWFVLPNPVYGTALKGGPDDVFPADKRWAPEESR